MLLAKRSLLLADRHNCVCAICPLAKSHLQFVWRLFAGFWGL
jgi:hypothetical protein